MRIQITLKAREDLGQIYQYYKDLGNGKHGRQVRSKITIKLCY